MKTQISAFQVKAKVEGKSWLTRGCTLVANNLEHATQLAKERLFLTDEHTITVEPVTVYSSSSKLITDSYPYGYLKTTAFFSVEYNGNKGARTTFQTINPKNGQLNKPKHSTYYRVLLPMQLENGHIEYCGYLDFNGSEAINKGLYFMADFYELFTIEQIKSIAVDIIAMSKVNAKAMCIYAGSNWDDLKPLVENSIKTLCKIANSGENLFLDCLLDVQAIEKTKVEGYQPFKVVQY